MDEVPRELQWAEAFVALADTLLDDFDIIDFLHVLAEHCVTLLNVTAAGVMIADHEGRLRVTASSTERAGLLELFDLQNDEGPGLDCYTQGTAVSGGGLGEPDVHSRWPRFAAKARASRFSVGRSSSTAVARRDHRCSQHVQ